MSELEAGKRLKSLLASTPTNEALAEAREMLPLFTSCPACGAEPWCDIDCKVCTVMSVLERLAL